jgi:methylmalonyl-CoA mutase N-terminal domain/subunit
MTDLSPAAQAVLDALDDQFYELNSQHMAAAVAALRAAADQVTPSDAIEPRNYLPMAIECQRIRAELLAIAAELEDQ